MSKKCLTCIRDALELADEMLELVHQSEKMLDDDVCLLIYGVIRDSAYKIRQAAERESSTVMEKIVILK